jgi:outer membrane receptor protein involved in Fe transport
MGIATLVLVAALTTAQAPAPRDGVADEADVLFALGNDAYGRADYERALSLYFASNRLAPNRNVVFNVARCYDRLARPVEAFRYYARYRTLSSAPRDVEAAEQAMARLRAQVALLKVTSTPAGATVYLDRVELGAWGVTPLEIAVAPGTYRVLLERSGSHPASTDPLPVVVGEAREVTLALTPLVGVVVVDGEPAGAVVRVGDVEVGRLPARISLPPGRQALQVAAPGFVTVTEDVDVVAEQETRLGIKLAVQTGALVVQADESGLPVRLDGEIVGFTPVVVDGVAAGPHELVVAAEGYRPFSRRVQVDGGGRTVLDVVLDADDLVTAASRTAESVLDAPASVTRISRTELTALGSIHLMDALVGTRGFFPNDDGTFLSLGVRGFSDFGSFGNRLLLQVHGHRVNDDWLGGSFVGYDFMPDLSMVDRIEVVRGPGSSLYGTGALYGVVNAELVRTLDHGVRAMGFTTGDGLAGVAANAGATLGKDAGVWVKAGGIAGQPFDYRSAVRATQGSGDGVARDVGGLAAGGAMARAWWRDVDVVAYLNQRNKNPPTGAYETTFGDPRTLDAERRGFVDVRFTPSLGSGLALSLRGYVDHFHYDGVFPYVDDGIVQQESFEGDWAGLDARLSWLPVDALRLTVGTEGEFHFINVGAGAEEPGEGLIYDENHPYVTASVYADVDWTIARWLRLVVGGRFDAWWITGLAVDDAVFGEGVRTFASFNPRFALIARPADPTRLKVLVGRAFRAPSIFEMTYSDGGITQVQSLDLDPEEVTTAEVEVSHHLTDDVVLVGATYVTHTAGLVRLTGAGNEDDPSRFVNEQVPLWAAGAELELRRELARGVFGALQYSLQRTRSESLLGTVALPNSPVQSAGGRLIVPVSGRDVRFATRAYVESGRLDREGEAVAPILLWDAILSGDLRGLGARWHAGVKNLLDSRVRYPVGDDIVDPTVPGDGRSFVLQLSWSA